MTGNKRYTLKEIDNFNYNLRVTDVIMDNGIELPQSTVCDLLNNQNAKINELERHIERNMISRITVEDVLGCAKDSRFYGNEEIAKAIDCIAKDLGVNLY